jgi:hypothetical protein
MLEAVDFRLEESVTSRINCFEKAAVRTAFSKSGSIHIWNKWGPFSYCKYYVIKRKYDG